MTETSKTPSEDWKEARYTGVSRVMRLGTSALLILATVVLFFLVDPTLRSSVYVIALVLALIAVGIYDIFNVLRSRLMWNEDGIKREGVFRTGKTHLWQDLTYVERSMNSRATVLTFKGVWKIKVFWAYRAHRELAAFAKLRLKENKSRRKWRKSKSKPDDSVVDKQITPVMTTDTPETVEPDENVQKENTQTRVEPTLTGPRSLDA